MSTLTRIIVTTVVSLVLLSCNFSIDMGESVNGNGNVRTEKRDISSDFNQIKISQGLELTITQSSDVALSIRADENLHDLIMTEVENSILKIYSTENIGRASSKKIILSVSDIESIRATSASVVNNTGTLKVTNLDLSCTSAAQIDLNVDTQNLDCKVTSASVINLSGNTKNLTASATSAGVIKASNLNSEIATAKATSAANITLNASKELDASATSAANIRYSGNPEKVNKSDTSAGSVKEQ